MERVDGLRPARLTIGIISAGRVGTALGVGQLTFVIGLVYVLMRR